MEVTEKADAIKALAETYAKLGDVERLDAVLAAFSGNSASADPEKRKNGSKRGPYKVTGIRRAFDDGCVVPPASLLQTVEAHQFIPGKTEEDKLKWLYAQVKKSPSVYRVWPDGSVSLRGASAPPANGK